MDVDFWTQLFYYLLLMAVALGGLVISLVGLPGLWLMVIAGAVYAIATEGTALAWPGMIALVGLATAAEIAEFLAGAEGSRRAGGGWRGIVGAVIGSIVGGIIGVPVPIVGPILGAILGAGIGAAALEFAGRTTAVDAGTIGWGAAKGRFWGTVFKGLFGVVMLAVLAFAAFPSS